LPQARLIVLASKFDPQTASNAPVLGVCTVLPRSISAPDMVAAIETAFHNPNLPVAPRNAEVVGKPLGADLTQRERSLLALMARGLPNREICTRLGIAMPTVKFHVTNILAKLQVENRTSAVLVALRHKIVTIDPS
jgi:NarL family two-component system response regulator LiaR